MVYCENQVRCLVGVFLVLFLLHGGHLHCGSLKESKDAVLAQTRVTLVDVCVLVYQINEVVHHVVDSCTDYRRWRLVCVDWH